MWIFTVFMEKQILNRRSISQNKYDLNIIPAYTSFWYTYREIYKNANYSVGWGNENYY